MGKTISKKPLNPIQSIPSSLTGILKLGQRQPHHQFGHRKASLTSRLFRWKKSKVESLHKLIFVQDFEKAFFEYRELTEVFPNDGEIHFRYIEVATRTDHLEAVKNHYKKSAQQNPQHQLSQLAWILCEIRWNTQIENSQLLKESLPSHSSKDVMGLSSRLDHSIQRYEPKIAGLLGSPNHSRTLLLSSGSLRISRTVSYPDDFSVDPDCLNKQETHLFATKQEPDSNPKSSLDFALKMGEISVANPNHHSVLFVQGCLEEFLGNLSQAIVFWKKAFLHKPESINILATLAELQQIGVLGNDEPDYGLLFEETNRFLVHGSLQTHMELYRKFLAEKEFEYAISAVRTLGDWMQKTRGEVPEEIEILTLLSSMKVYSTKGNLHLSEVCRREAENLAIDCKKNSKNPSQLAFIAQTAEEFGMIGLAKMCYFTVLNSNTATLELVRKIADHCVRFYVSLSLLECIRVAVKNHRGDKDLRTSFLTCELRYIGCNEDHYMEQKNSLISHYSEGGFENDEFSKTLEYCQKITENDEDVQFIAAQYFEHTLAMDKALRHYQSMYELDSIDASKVTFFLKFLLKINNSQRVLEMTKNVQEMVTQGNAEKAVIYTLISRAHRNQGNLDLSQSFLEESLRVDPWNLESMIYSLGSMGQNPASNWLNKFFPLLSEISDKETSNLESVIHKNKSTLISLAEEALVNGYFDLSFTTTKIMLLYFFSNKEVVEIYTRTAAAFDYRVAAQHTMLLLNRELPGKGQIPLHRLAMVIAEIHAYNKDWPLMEEWIDIAARAEDSSDLAQPMRFYLKALQLLVMGKDWQRSRSLLESLAEMGDKSPIPTATIQAMLGYTLIVLGEPKLGSEKLKTLSSENQTLIGSYFTIKGLSRLTDKSQLAGEIFKKLVSFLPTNALEVSFVQEIYCTYGGKKDSEVLGLVS